MSNELRSPWRHSIVVSVLLEVSKDEADYYSFDTAGRICIGGRDVEAQVHFFLVSIGDYSTIFNGQCHVRKVNRSRGKNLCDIPFHHSKCFDVVEKRLSVSS
jgi:hypothetical protein